MISLRRIFSKYTGFLRNIKPLYVVNNLLHRNQLQHNEALYKKYGLEKSIFGNLSSKDFTTFSKDLPWLDRPDAKQKLHLNPDFQAFNVQTQEQIINFIDNGYMVLKGFHNDTKVGALNQDIDRLLHKKKTNFNYTGKKIMEANLLSTTADKDFFRNKRLLKLLRFIMGKEIVPFHTINFIEGSEQRAHSDFIHMTTEPRGYLVAAWTALEDCHEGNGPLFFYPGSHRLPYILSDDYNSGSSKWLLNDNSYKNYEDHIEAFIKEKGLKKEYFYAKKGDVFIWHANLLHGGSPIIEAGATRKSMVAHYFCEGVICYHEISERPALMP